MNKETAVKKFIRIEPIPYASIEYLVPILGLKEYNLSKSTGLHSRKVKIILDTIAPDRKPGEKLCSYLFRTNNHKFCSKCENVQPISNFTLNKSRKDGVNSNCKTCQYETFKTYWPEYYLKNRDKYAAYKIKYKLQLNKSTPKWANLDKIKEIYLTCPEGYHVDHIIPLQGENVCGLHVETNLQHLTAFENISKKNKFSS